MDRYRIEQIQVDKVVQFKYLNHCWNPFQLFFLQYVSYTPNLYCNTMCLNNSANPKPLLVFQAFHLVLAELVQQRLLVMIKRQTPPFSQRQSPSHYKQSLYFYMYIVIFQGYQRTMTDPLASFLLTINPNPPKKPKNHKKQTNQPQKPQAHHNPSTPAEADSEESSQHWSQEIIQPAIKTMSFRKRRGTRMKELMKGKRKKDTYQQQYQNYFGGDLNQSDDSDQEDYQASSSGRDQFDSDFDLTDSYVGKRGRKKGSKVSKRKKVIVKGEKAHDSKGRFVKKGRGAQKKEEEEEGSQEKSDKVEVEGNVQAQTTRQASRSYKKKMQIQSESIINEPQNNSSQSSRSASKQPKASTVPTPNPNPSPIQDTKLI